MNSIDKLNGIGPKTKELFKKIHIETIEDLLYYYPSKYHLMQRTDMKNIKDGCKVIVDGIVDGSPIITPLKNKLKKITVRLSNQRNIYNIQIFNQTYLYHELSIGTKITVIGKYERKKNIITASEVRKGLLPSKPYIESIYHSTSNLNQKVITKFIQLALTSGIEIEDNIPEHLSKKYHFLDKMESIRQIHHPSDNLLYKKAVQRLKYEEFFTYLYKIKLLKEKRLHNEKAIIRKIDDKKIEELMKKIPFQLTKDQLKAIEEIKKDLSTQIRMNRLIQGDVGSGKTIIAFFAAYMNFLSGYQTALMVPTEILANQHFKNAIEFFKNNNMNIELLTSNTKNKKKIYQDLLEGKIDFIIGTQSLIQEKLKYKNLGLIITDEQHRFGVNQREELKNKGIMPDVLSMSATPIPRTYALTIYGDMDVSSIKTKPKGRKEVITYLKKEKEINEVLGLIKKEIDHHHQIYIIAPSIEENDNKELNNVQILKEKFELAFNKIAKIGLIHGNLSNDEKDSIMKDFEKNKIQILISTTVIEVGVNVPNASMIVIFQANYFGLSTLHQLRGRVGRGDIQSYCILICKEEQERIKMLETCTDGFKISEYDFTHRGEGDLFGTKQSGDAKFRLADLKKDFQLLLRVKEDIDSLTK